MTIGIEDRSGLLAISPAALAAYARAEGWSKTETYGNHSDVYNGGTLPEIIVPRTKDLADYASIVTRLIKIFSSVAKISEFSLYNDLMTVDRDIIRVRVDGEDSTVDLNEGANLITGARDMLLAAACSLDNPKPLYRPKANRKAVAYLNHVRLGQTEPGSFVVTLLSPAITPSLQNLLSRDTEDVTPSKARRMTSRLFDALTAIREATNKTTLGDAEAFDNAVVSGASANLCDALIQMTEPFQTLDISVTWARTQPMSIPRHAVQFTNNDTPILNKAVLDFREREPITGVHLRCSVQKLERDDGKTGGTVILRTIFKDKTLLVKTILNRPDYDQAIDAHKEKVEIVATGNLNKFRQRWHLRNPQIIAVIKNDSAETE